MSEPDHKLCGIRPGMTRKGDVSPRKLPADQVQRLRELVKSGMSLSWVADHTGVGKTTVHRYCKDLVNERGVPLSTGQISQLLGGWRRAAA